MKLGLSFDRGLEKAAAGLWNCKFVRPWGRARREEVAPTTQRQSFHLLRPCDVTGARDCVPSQNGPRRFTAQRVRCEETPSKRYNLNMSMTDFFDGPYVGR
jgi:hypothetical protein